MDLYKILEVDKNSTINEIKKAYKKLALKYHPDKSCNIDTISQFIEINNAYTILSDDKKRKEYNSSIYRDFVIKSPKKNNNYNFVDIMDNLKNIIKNEYYQRILLIFGDKILNIIINNNNIEHDLNFLDINISINYTLEEVINLEEKVINYKRRTKDNFIENIFPIDFYQNYKNEGEEIILNNPIMGYVSIDDYYIRGDLNIKINITEKTYYNYKYEILNNDLYTTLKNVICGFPIK